ncbi:unnamed protein product [Rhizophagus irregularis]|uniref:Tc1-like transposase DDE domain-containing protein n=1 Tax=Rhizophagus irregularis TaxID=588596 RepID=A0A916E5F6_9GLOM|nr:unnamed protein product [Rhizophagus irregularis]CAB5363806.1 unnamed protein product [Rhizophagus irregularis]
MGHFYLGKDIRKLIIQKTLLGRHSISQISKECHVSKTFVKDVRRYYKKHGVLENSNKKKARRKSKLQQERIMVKLLLKKSDWYLDELAAKVTKYQQKYLNDKPNNLSVSVSTVCRTLKSLGFFRKKLSRKAKERNEIERISFIMRMKNFSLEQFVFVDETAKDERTPFRSYGYSSSNRRAEIKCPFIRGKRYTIEGTLGINGIIAHCIQEVMDNCSIHKSLRTYEILAAYGVKLIFLPAYSPGLNSIEQCFSYVKGFLHRYHEWVEREYDAYYVLNMAFNLIESVKLKHVLLMRVMHNLLFDSLIYLTNYQNG